MVISRTDNFNKKYSSKIPYVRLNHQTLLDNIPSLIFHIGTDTSIQTYPQNLHNLFIKIGTISLYSKDFDMNEKLNKALKNNFLWIGSNGSILKGLDSVIESFALIPDLILHVVGPIDKEVKAVLKSITSDNIIFYGELNLNSEIFLKIINSCVWSINLSSSEGIPGSLINSMRMGCIPIMSRYSSYSDKIDVGYTLESIDYQSIANFLQTTKTLDLSDAKNMMLDTLNLAKRFFSEETFQARITNIIKDYFNY
jgi:glycosyltransferase involved in cell wall biosynthesis